MREERICHFNRHYETYKNLVFKIALDKIHDFYLAQDICQDTFVKFYENMDRLHEDNEVKGWLITTASHKSIDYIRKIGRQNTLAEASLPSYYEQFPDASFDPVSEEVLKREFLYQVLESLRDTHPSWYDALIKNHYGASSSEASESLGISIQTYRTHLRRARVWIRERYGEDYHYIK